MPIRAKYWVTKNHSVGLPKVEDFLCLEEDLPLCRDGDVIIQAEVLSVDPYMRYQIRQKPLGSVVTGSQVAKVIESRNKDLPLGTIVVGYPGWRTHTHVTKTQFENKSGDILTSYRKIPPMGILPKSLALGTVGMPGNTAFFGFLEICQPKPGDVVVVSAAAGTVGSVVSQIANLMGCKVLAFAGTEGKISWLKDLGIEHSFNYKDVDIQETIKEHAPEGVNCYFDNVGGHFTSQILPHMANFGRISVCGCISTVNDEKKDIGSVSLTSPYSEATILHSQLKVEGFLVARWWQRWDQGLSQLRRWVEEGKVKYKESVSRGFDTMPQAFISLFEGENIGKTIVTP